MPTRVEPAINFRCVSRGLVARLSRSLMLLLLFLSRNPSPTILAAMQHPANQTIQFAIGKWTRISGDAAVRSGRVKQRMHFAVKLLFERPHKFGQTRAEAGNADRLDAFLPGVLVIGGYWIDIFQEHVRCEIRAACRQFRAAIATQDTLADNGRGQGGAGDSCEECGATLID